MFFKVKYSVRDLWLGDLVQFAYSINNNHQCLVTLRPPSDQEQKNGHSRSNAMSEALMETDPSPSIQAMFGQLAENRLPQGSEIPSDCSYVTKEGEIAENHIVPRSWLPQSFKSFVGEIERELLDYLKRSVFILRWRLGEPGPHNPFGSLLPSWSFDGADWKPLPSETSVRIHSSGSVKGIDHDVIEHITKLVLAGNTEPIGHELFREAYEQMGSNPRSALVIGIAAIETGLKDCVSKLAPDTSWIVQNLQTPPLGRLLREYLPLLKTNNELDHNLLSQINKLVTSVQKGVSIRNSIAHTGKESPKYDTVKEVLDAVGDLLWILDYLKGHEWALNHVSWEKYPSLPKPQ